MEKKKIEPLPELPGVYIFKNSRGEIIYIGKAKSISKRVKDHLALRTNSLKERNIVSEIADVEYIVTSSESEALLLESYLIKERQPRYNVNYRDDKTYPWVKISLSQEFPRVYVTRRKRDDGSLYLGPYPEVGSLRRALKTIRKIFPYASCRNFPRSACLYYHLSLCPAPCIKKIGKLEYRKNIIGIIKVLLGDIQGLIQDLTQEMDKYVKNADFENAAVIRDKIKVLGTVSSLFVKDMSLNVLENIKEKLRLPHLPRIIDAIDISNISGTSAVGSVIRFKDLKPAKDCYRRFKLKRQNYINDYQMMAEVVLRRFEDIIKNKEELPALLVVDGGKGHLNTVDKVLKEKLGLDIPVVAYAKGKDVIYSKYRKSEIKFSQDSSEKYLLERIRNEAHRFAIGYHKILRRKKVKSSVLHNVPGIGEERVKRVLKVLDKLGGLERINIQDLKRIQGIGDVLAERIYTYLKEKRSQKTD
ncbi:MAG: hypothetical protein DRP73_03315 [Candidatus Omnitrophota bacterium]|nr:MAG: hypothetical protein DRP73_03315 [Candidatus Omnitrophota bacterium]